jgi:hypothetical protein
MLSVCVRTVLISVPLIVNWDARRVTSRNVTLKRDSSSSSSSYTARSHSGMLGSEGSLR